jgi:hypothetical protein
METETQEEHPTTEVTGVCGHVLTVDHVSGERTVWCPCGVGSLVTAFRPRVSYRVTEWMRPAPWDDHGD